MRFYGSPQPSPRFDQYLYTPNFKYTSKGNSETWWRLWNPVSVLVVGKSCQQNGPSTLPAASTSNSGTQGVWMGHYPPGNQHIPPNGNRKITKSPSKVGGMVGDMLGPGRVLILAFLAHKTNNGEGCNFETSFQKGRRRVISVKPIGSMYGMFARIYSIWCLC